MCRRSEHGCSSVAIRARCLRAAAAFRADVYIYCGRWLAHGAIATLPLKTIASARVVAGGEAI